MVNKNRRAFSLLELMVTMTVASALMAVNVVWLHHSMSFSRQMKNRQQHHQQLTQLSRQLRDDVRSSQKISVKDSELILEANGQKITYTISGNSILLEKQLGSAADSVKRERYSFYKHSMAEWDQSELPNWISLVVRRLPETPQPISIDSGAKPEVVDLHVRVAPNRWPSIEVKRPHEVSDAKEAEAKK